MPVLFELGKGNFGVIETEINLLFQHKNIVLLRIFFESSEVGVPVVHN